MAVKETIIINIDGKSTGAVNATKKTESAISQLGGVLKKMAIAGGALFLAKKGFDIFSAALKKTISFLKSSTEAAAFQELQIKKLDTALKSTGNYTEKVSKALQDYASSLQNVTMYGDETIIGVEAMLATFKLSEEQIKVATQATLDLAAATGQDLQSAAILLGKAMVGETGMLKRYGIIVDENKLKSEGWRAVIEEINTEFGGQAVAQGETYTGMIARMKNAFGDMKEKVGEALIPTLKKLVDWFTKGSDIIGPFGQKIGETASPFEKLKSWVGEATEKFRNFLELNWDKIIGLAESTFEKIENFITIVKEADYSEIQQGIKDLGAAFGILIGDSSSGITGADKKYQEFINTVGRSIQTVATIAVWFKAIGDTIYFVVGTITNSIAILIEFLGALGLWFISVGTEGQKEFEHVDLMMQALKDTTIEGYEHMKESWSTFIEFMDDSTSTTTKEVKSNLEEIKKKGIEVGGYSYPQITFTDNTNEVRKHIDTLQEAINKLRGKNITNTITTIYKETRVATMSPWSPWGRQSGGLARKNEYAPDLRIPIFQGEAVLPASIVRAIKENRGSFAGLNSRSGNTIKINVSGNYIADDRDEEELAERIGNIIVRKLDEQGALTG